MLTSLRLISVLTPFSTIILYFIVVPVIQYPFGFRVPSSFAVPPTEAPVFVIRTSPSLTSRMVCPFSAVSPDVFAVFFFVFVWSPFNSFSSGSSVWFWTVFLSSDFSVFSITFCSSVSACFSETSSVNPEIPPPGFSRYFLFHTYCSQQFLPGPDTQRQCNRGSSHTLLPLFLHSFPSFPVWQVHFLQTNGFWLYKTFFQKNRLDKKRHQIL